MNDPNSIQALGAAKPAESVLKPEPKTEPKTEPGLEPSDVKTEAGAEQTKGVKRVYSTRE